MLAMSVCNCRPGNQYQGGYRYRWRRGGGFDVVITEYPVRPAGGAVSQSLSELGIQTHYVY